MKRAVSLRRAVGEQVKLLGPVVEGDVRWILLFEGGKPAAAARVSNPRLQVVGGQRSYFESHGMKSGRHKPIAEGAHNCGNLRDAVILSDQNELGVLHCGLQNGQRGTIQVTAGEAQAVAVLEDPLVE